MEYNNTTRHELLSAAENKTTRHQGTAGGLLRGVDLCVIGGGFVGLVTAAGFAQFGHSVTCVERDGRRLSELNSGRVPFYEPELAPLLTENFRAKRVRFTDDLKAAVRGCRAIFITVGTPSAVDGRTNLQALHEVIASLEPVLEDGQILVLKSTVPVGTGGAIQAEVDSRLTNGRRVAVVNNPEFLREGQAVHDFFHPQRIVVGGEDAGAVAAVAHFYRLGMTQSVPIVTVNNQTAEMIKYASNAFIALKVGFVNELAGLCDRTGINVLEVARAMGMDPRIGDEYLVPGPGWGGSCLGKDLRELQGLAASYDYNPEIVRAIQAANVSHQEHVVSRIDEMVGALGNARVGILGLSFKAGTSDVRESPALAIARRLLAAGAQVVAFDPKANGEAKDALPDLKVVDTAYAVAEQADCLAVLTEWPDFQSLDFQRIARSMRRPCIMDARNLLVPEMMRRFGFEYRGIGQV